MKDSIAEEMEVMRKEILKGLAVPECYLIGNNGRYPHKCPQCGSPAYIGLISIECSGDCSK
jgi:hypothetical protein